jgi:hypothetical protein
MNHEPLTPQLVSLVGFAATAYADEYLVRLGENDRRYLRLRDAGLRVHQEADLLAAAPRLHEALASLLELFRDHEASELHTARHVVHRATVKTVPQDGYQLNLL